MQGYIKYELELRKYSSNVIIGIYETTNDKGKTIEKRDVILCPVLKKEEGDVYANVILNFLRTTLL